MPAVILFFGLGPLVFVGWLLHRKKARHKAEAAEPFTELPLRPAGESVRLELEKLSESFDERLQELALTSTGTVIMAIVAPEGQRKVVIIGLGIIALFSYIRNVPKLFRTAEQIWNHRLGFAGERMVAEELNQLLVQGFRVFHDLPFDRFNIDHVIVGPPGVYAVETKTRRKYTHIKGRDRAKIIYKNGCLEFPTGARETGAIDQARLNATTLGKWLTKATGEPVKAEAILTFPGWFVERHEIGDVNVLNPAQIKKSFPFRTALAPAQIERIVYQLTERCRMPREKTK